MSTAVPRPPDESVEHLLADLDRAGRIQRSILAEARALPPDPAEERLIASLPRSDPATRRRRALRVLAPVLTAAAVLALAWFAWLAPGSGTAPRGEDEVLGTALALLEPLGETPSLETFRWTGAERASWYVVVVFDAENGAEIDRSPQIEDTRWQVPPERWKGWPRAIRWEVRPFDAAGRLGRPASAQASLSP
jgi:hypothetical protein